MLSGRCHCGAVQYQMSADVAHHSLCHCTDCRRASGASAVSWALVKREDITIEGQPKAYESSPGTQRLFCADCGTSLFFVNETIFPGMIDVQSATLDDPDAIAMQGQIQTAERIGWMGKLESLPAFERYPPMD